MPKVPKYCWDTTIYLNWLGAEACAPLSDIAAVIEEIEDKKANLLVPVTAYMEVLEAANSAESMEQFNLFLKRSNVITIELTMQIANKVAAVRSAGLRCRPPRKIETPDAQFIAAAILYQADVFHTLDAKLLKLSGSEIVDGLRITLPGPISGQRLMFS